MQPRRTHCMLRLLSAALVLASVCLARHTSREVEEDQRGKEGQNIKDGREKHSAPEETKDIAERGEGEEDQKEEEEEKETEEEEEASPEQAAYNISISAMLLGAVAFQMMIFYTVNSRDADIRYYSWSIISCTISIFTSVLCFSAFNRLVHRLLLEGCSYMVKVFAEYAILIVWLLFLDFFIMLIARRRQGESNDTKLMMACWGSLMAHMSGFASIAAGGSVQHLPFIRTNPWLVFATAPLHCGVIFIVFALLAFGRRAFSHGGTEDEARLWQDSVLEAENDASSIAMSFLLVQALRFHISGVLPSAEGLEEPPLPHPWGPSGLASCALIFAGLIVVTLHCRRKYHHDLPHYAHRLLEVVQGTSAMAFAWCLFYAAKWELKIVIPDSDPNLMQWRVALAITLSAAAFAFIFVLDKIADLEATGEEVDKAIINIIGGLGVLVGFSWEQSFDGAVEHLSARLPQSSVSELCLALLVAIIVVPAWRQYILRNMKKAHSRVDEEVRTHSFMDEFGLEVSDDAHFDMLQHAAVPATDSDDRSKSVARAVALAAAAAPRESVTPYEEEDGSPLRRRDLLKDVRRHTCNPTFLRSMKTVGFGGFAEF